MKNIIRYFSVAAIAVAIATMVGCTKEDMNNGLTFTTTVEMPANGIKALNGNGHKTFAVGDKIKLTYGSNTIESEPLTADDLSNDNKAAKFTFVFEEDPLLPEDMDIMYEYPATYSGLDGQNGTIGYIAEYCDYATWTGKVTSEGHLPGNISLTNQYVILKLKINHGGNDITSTITGLTVANGGNTVSVSPSSLSEIYVAMPAVTTGDIVFTATDGSNNYTKTVTGQTLAQGSLYPVNLAMLLPCSYTAPTLRTGLTFNGNSSNVYGSAQALVTGGSATNATIYYSTNGGSSWSTDVPTQTNAGSYTVYYKVEPNDGYYGGVESTSLGSSSMAKANGWCNLSSYSSSGWRAHGSRTSDQVSISHHGGSLSYSKGGAESYRIGYLNVSISGNTLYLSRSSNWDSCTDNYVIVTSAATTNYKAASARYTCDL